MAVATKAQVGMEDKFIENPELEQLLEEREAAKAEAAKFRALDNKAKGMIIGLELDGERRCGRFLVSKKNLEGRMVESFETKGGVRVNIKTADKE